MPLSDAPIPRIGEETEVPEGIRIAKSKFMVTQIIYRYRRGWHDRPWDYEITVLLERRVATVSVFLTVGFSHARYPNGKWM